MRATVLPQAGRALIAIVAIGTGALVAASGSAPQHGQQPHSHEQMLAAGAQAMGFDQTRTFHHFRLLPSGGVIEVHVNDPADIDSRRRIATHLEHISQRFAQGDFTASLATHGVEPPGVATLKRLADRLRYRFEPTAVGGRVRITTADAESLAALHTFLAWQIREHRTGDPVEVDR